MSKAALHQPGQSRLQPATAAGRQATERNQVFDVERSVLRQLMRQMVRRGGSPRFDQESRGWQLRPGKRPVPRSLAEPDQARAGSVFPRRQDPVSHKAELLKGRGRADANALIPRSAKRRRQIAFAVEKIEIRQDDPVVVSAYPDSRAGKVSGGQEDARLFEPDRQIRAAFAFPRCKQENEAMEAGIESSRIKSVSRVSRDPRSVRPG